MDPPRYRWRLALPPLWLCAACLHLHPAPRPVTDGDHILLTEEMIARSGAQNAWEALKRLVPQFRFSERRDGLPTQLERRGQSSMVLNDAPRVFVDGTDVVDFRSLAQIPAQTISSIEILNGIEGTTYYGGNAVGGVILIRTKNGS